MAEHRFSYLQNGNMVCGIAAGDGANLAEAEAIAIGKAFSNWLIYKVGKNPAAMQVCVGIDSRESSKELSVGLMKGLHAFGTVTGYAGEVTAPAMFMTVALPYWEYDGAIFVSAGDQSDKYNGFKFYTADGILTEEEVADVLYHASRAYLSHEEYEPEPIRLMPIYASVLRAGIGSLEGVKVYVDTSNMAGEFLANEVLAPMKAELVTATEADVRITMSMDGERCIVKDKEGNFLRAEDQMDVTVPDGMRDALKIISGFVK